MLLLQNKLSMHGR